MNTYKVLTPIRDRIIQHAINTSDTKLINEVDKHLTDFMFLYCQYIKLFGHDNDSDKVFDVFGTLEFEHCQMTQQQVQEQLDEFLEMIN